MRYFTLICHSEPALAGEESRASTTRSFAYAQDDGLFGIIQQSLYRLSFIVIALCCISTHALAQDISFIASVDKNNITTNDKVQLTLTVSGSQEVGTPELPSLDGFQIISQGSSSQFSFINARMSVSKSFTYILMPVKEGTLTIGSATVEVGGDIYRTDPLTIEVLPGGAAPRPSPKKPLPTVPAAPTTPAKPEEIKERIFIEVTTDKEEAYLGEKIIMTFRLYFRGVTIDNLQYTPPVTKGFVTESMGPQREYRDTVNGVAYKVIELKTAIFPASSGILSIEPAKLKCDLLVREYRRRPARRRGGGFDGFFDDFFDDSFFTPYSRYPLELESNPVTIIAKPLPADGKPGSFRGAVGTYDLLIEVSPQSVKVGEPINISMKISGAGNISSVPEPIMENLEGFKTYESEVKTNITGREPEIAGEKIFQKIIIPQNENIKEIPAIKFSFFDPLKEKYRTITKGPMPITVLPAPEKKPEIVELIKEIAPEEEAKKAVKLLARDIQYIKTSPGTLFETGEVWYRNLWLWSAIIVLPIILFILNLLYQTHRVRLKEDTAYAKVRGAYKTATQVLKEAVALEKQNKPKEFYDTLARAIQKYISDKLNLPPGAVSVDSLASKKISPGIIKRIKSLLNTCDLARFGATTFSPQDMKGALKEGLNLIKILNKKI